MTDATSRVARFFGGGGGVPEAVSSCSELIRWAYGWLVSASALLRLKALEEAVDRAQQRLLVAAWQAIDGLESPEQTAILDRAV